ncbi:MAG: hypothetical protein NVSMB44_29040 [Ktedonobacteraceae bacterium]
MFHLYRKTARLFVVAASLGLLLLVMAACGKTNDTTLNTSSSSLSGSTSAPGNSQGTSHDDPTYQFQTLNDKADPTFNQLLGINNQGVIAGYFGSGTVVNGTLHPNKGYTLSRPYGQGNYTNENFPGSVQTQVTAINNSGATTGFWVDAKGNNFGFIKRHGTFTSYKDPNTGTSNGVQVNQLLGLNNNRVAVGFYTDSAGNDHGYTLDLEKGTFTELPTANIPGAVSVMATGINDNGDIVGTETDAAGVMHGFFIKKNHVHFHVFDYKGVANVSGTTFLGVNSHDQIVGSYTVGTGTTARMHGFIMANPLQNPKWQSIDAPNGVGTTTINGLNDNDDLVGFYVDANGNTDGLLIHRT